MYLMDEDEFDEAYNNKSITYEQYIKAIETANKIMNEIRGNETKLRTFCSKYFQILKEKL